MKTSSRGIGLIKDFEGVRLSAYHDVVGVLTIGYGHTGPDVSLGQTITPPQATRLLVADIANFEAAVIAACTTAPNQNQFDALVCFAYNVGIGGLRKSSVLKAHNRHDFQSAARAFALWNKAGGKVWPGLVRRRAAEAALYLEPVADVESAPMPQAVDHETPMTASPINRTSVIAGGASAAAAISEVTSAIAQVKSGVDALQAWLVPVLLIAVVCLCGYLVWQRYQQRKGGWA